MIEYEALKKVIDKCIYSSMIVINTVYNVTVDLHWKIPDRKIDDYLLIMIKSGNGTFIADSKKYEITPGKIILVSPGIRHSAEKTTDQLSLFSIRFRIVEKDLKVVDYRSAPSFSVELIPNNIPSFFSFFNDAIDYYNWQKGAEVTEQLCHASILRLLSCFYIEWKTARENRTFDYRLESSRLYIENHIEEGVSIHRLAEKAQLTPSYFSKLFKQQYGISPNSYIFQCKMTHAKYLLTEVSLSVKETAYLLGYSDPYIFSNLFKKTYGISPSRVE